MLKLLSFFLIQAGVVSSLHCNCSHLKEVFHQSFELGPSWLWTLTLISFWTSFSLWKLSWVLVASGDRYFDLTGSKTEMESHYSLVRSRSVEPSEQESAEVIPSF